LFGRLPEELRLDADEAERLQILLSSLDAAIGLASAELRGADAALRDMRTKELELPEIIDLRPDDVKRAGISDAIAEVEKLVPNGQLVDRLRAALARQTIGQDAQRLEAVAAQYTAALDGLQPSDPESVRNSLIRSLETTRAEMADLTNDTTSVDEIATTLDELGLTAGPDDLLETAERVVAEADELNAIAARLRIKLDNPLAKGRTDNTPSPLLLSIQDRRAFAQRRLHSLRKLRAAAHEQLAAQSVNTNFMLEVPIGSSTGHSPDGRQLPVVVDDVSSHLPPSAIASLRTMLGRLAAATQVVVLSADAGQDSRPAPGWFGGLEN